jgi:hypothetical protein
MVAYIELYVANMRTSTVLVPACCDGKLHQQQYCTQLAPTFSRPSCSISVKWKPSAADVDISSSIAKERVRVHSIAGIGSIGMSWIVQRAKAITAG